MNKKFFTWIAIGVALIVVLMLGVLNGVAQGPFGEKPTPIPPRIQTPAPTPEDNREIAILTLVISSSPEGKIEAVDLERGRIIKSYAPNVLGLAGEWMIELIGREETTSFGVPDPRHVEVENEQGAESPFTYIYETNYAWDLVVPLYNDGKDLQVQVIRIYDGDGNQIFETPVNESWRQ